MGRLLDMGPEGDVGGCHMDGIYRLYPSQASLAQPPGLLVAHRRIPAAADVLVWCELPALGKLEHA